MGKYIIKNCPLYYNQNGFNYCRDLYKVDCSIFCEKRPDCLLKRIVELCNRYQLRCKVCPTHDVCFECESVSGKQLSDEVLNLLEIEKVE